MGNVVWQCYSFAGKEVTECYSFALLGLWRRYDASKSQCQLHSRRRACGHTGGVDADAGSERGGCTISGAVGVERPADLVKRNFHASAPNRLWVADLTYVATRDGFAYTAFVIDAFAGLIPGWECSLSKRTAFVESAIRQAAGYRTRQGHPLSGRAIHHSDAGAALNSSPI